jgi:hypothetical protein
LDFLVDGSTDPTKLNLYFRQAGSLCRGQSFSDGDVHVRLHLFDHRSNREGIRSLVVAGRPHLSLHVLAHRIHRFSNLISLFLGNTQVFADVRAID